MRDEVRIKSDEIIGGIAHKGCPHCGESKSLDGFGLRRMPQKNKEAKLVVPQSWCRDCRAKASA
jgi:hypothetical protein